MPLIIAHKALPALRDHTGHKKKKCQSTQRKCGFALVEVLMGSLILALGVLLINGLSSRCMVDNLRGLEYEQAARLLDECLEEASATETLKKLINLEKIEGDFRDRYPNYRYLLELEPTEHVDLYQITATVIWTAASKQYQLEAATLLFDLK